MSLTISAAQVDALIANPSSFGSYSASGPIIITGAITFTQANNLNAVDATYIQATISETTVTNLGSIAVNNSTRASLNKFSVVVSDTSATAAELNAVQALTSVAADFTNVAAIEASSASDITTLYSASTATTSGLGAETISVNDSTIVSTTLNTIDGYTTAAVTTTATTISGPIADTETALGSAGIVHAGDIAVTVTDTTVDAANINDVAQVLTTGVVAVSSSATSLSGTAAEVNTALTAARTSDGTNALTPTITGILALNATLDDPDTTGTQTTAVADFHAIVDIVGYTGKVTATITEGGATALAHATTGLGNTGTGHSLTVTVTDAAATATELTTISAATILPVTLDSDGTAGDAITSIESSTYATALALFQEGTTGFTGLSASPVIVSDSITVAQANALDALTTGAITATISDQALSVLGGLTGTGNAYTTVVQDTTAAASDLNALIAKTSVAVDASASTTITGNLTDLNAFYVTNAAGVTGEGSEAVTVSDTAIDAALLTAVNAATDQLVTLSSATSISGQGDHIEALYDANATNQLAGLDGDLTVTITGDAATPTQIEADNLLAIDGDTTGLITIDSTATSISGSYSNVHDVFTQSKTRADANDTTGVATPTISGLSGLAVTLTGTTSLANFLNIQNDYTTGVVTATLEARTKAQLLLETTAGTNDLVSGNNLAFDVSDATFTTTELIELNSMTTGTIDFTNAGAVTISGTAAELKAIFATSVADGNDGILSTALADALATTTDTGTVDAADLVAIRAATTGVLDITTVGRISGLLTDVNAILTDAGGNISGHGTELVTITDATVSASALATLLVDGAGLTSADVTIAASTIEGTAAEVDAIIAANGLVVEHATDHSATVTGLAAINVTLTGTPTASEVNAVATRTTGTVTASIVGTQTMAALLAGLTETTGHALTISLADADVTAANLNTLSTLTTGTIALDTAATAGVQSPGVAGTVTDLNTAFADSKITGLSASVVTVTGGATVAEINALAALTTGNVIATITDGDMATLAGITETTNALGITVTDASISATALTALDAKTTGQLNVAATSTLTGTLAEVTAALGATGTITGVGAMLVSVTGSITVAEANTLAGLTSSAVTATITETDLASLITLETGNSWITTVATQVAEDTTTTAVELDTVISAANLATLDGLTDQVVTVTAPTMDGTLAEVTAAIALNTAGTVTGLDTKAITITDASITQAEVQTADGFSTGVLTATVATDDVLTVDTPGAAVVTSIAAIDTLAANGADGSRTAGTYTGVASTSGGSGTGATFTVVVGANGAATVTLVAPGIGYADDEAITINDSVLGGGGGANITLAVNGLTTTRPAATYSNVATTTAGTGSGLTLNVVVAADGSATATVGNAGGSGYAVNETVTVLDSALGGGGAAALTFDVATLGKISIADFIATTTTNNVTTYNVESGNALAVTFDDASISAADLIVANSLTSGLITLTNAAGGETTLTGTTADLVSVYAAAVASGDGILTTSYAASPLTIQEPETFGGLISAASLVSLDAATTGVITVDVAWDADGADGDDETTITGITGSYADVHAVLTQDKTRADANDTTGVATPTIAGIEAAGNTVTLTGTTTVAQANDISGNYTIGAVTATISETDMATLDTITDTGNVYTITVADASVAAANLNTLNGKTTGLVTVTSTTLTGARADIDTALGTATTEITGLAAINVTQSDAATTAQINTTAALTTGALTATVSDTDLATLGGLNETGNVYTMTVADASIDAATVNVLNGKTTGVITLSATAVTGALSDIKALYDANTAGEVTGLGNETITISDTGSISSADLNDLNALTTGVVTATGATGLSGSLSELLSSYSDSNIAGVITGLANEAVTVSDTGSVAAADLNTLDGKTTGTVTVSAATTLTGSYSDITTAYAAAGLSGLGNEAITITGSLTVAEANAVDALTTGVVTATISTTDMDALETLTGTTNAYAITLADSSVSATKLTALNAKTTGTITVSSSTVTGTASAITTVYGEAGISGLGSEAITVDSGTASVAQVNTLGALTTGTLTATVTEGDATTLKTITESGNALSITVTDTSAAAADLSSLDAATTSTVTVTSTTLTGTNAEKLAAYTAHTAGTMTGLDTAFDAVSYLASHADLLAAYGSSTVLAKAHFFDYGLNESRELNSFDSQTYLASYDDLIAAFGSNTTSALTHYVSHGYGEGRAADAFDELGYVASYSDLISALGASSTAATDHYINYGYSEGRTTTFDASSYLSAYSDLQTAFGTDLELAKQHYINHGYSEGRVIA